MKELELEAKERQRKAAQVTNETLRSKTTLPQMSAEALNDDPQPPHPERRHIDTAPASAQPTTDTAETKKPAKKDKAEGEAREKAA